MLPGLSTSCGPSPGSWNTPTQKQQKQLKGYARVRKHVPKKLAKQHDIPVSDHELEDTGLAAEVEVQSEAVAVPSCNSQPGGSFDDVNNMAHIQGLNMQALRELLEKLKVVKKLPEMIETWLKANPGWPISLNADGRSAILRTHDAFNKIAKQIWTEGLQAMSDGIPGSEMVQQEDSCLVAMFKMALRLSQSPPKDSGDSEDLSKWIESLAQFIAESSQLCIHQHVAGFASNLCQCFVDCSPVERNQTYKALQHEVPQLKTVLRPITSIAVAEGIVSCKAVYSIAIFG